MEAEEVANILWPISVYPKMKITKKKKNILLLSRIPIIGHNRLVVDGLSLERHSLQHEKFVGYDWYLPTVYPIHLYEILVRQSPFHSHFFCTSTAIRFIIQVRAKKCVCPARSTANRGLPKERYCTGRDGKIFNRSIAVNQVRKNRLHRRISKLNRHP